MSSPDIEERDILLISGYLRTESNKLNIIIPQELTTLFYKCYHLLFEIVKFSTIYLTEDAFILSDDNKCCKRIDGAHAYILADCNPVFEGIHCWRVQVINPEKDWI